MRWAENVVHTEWMKNAYKIFIGNLEGNRPLRRPRRVYEDIIKMDLVEIG
jgi:hypothetical protein